MLVPFVWIDHFSYFDFIFGICSAPRGDNYPKNGKNRLFFAVELREMYNRYGDEINTTIIAMSSKVSIWLCSQIMGS